MSNIKVNTISTASGLTSLTTGANTIGFTSGTQTYTLGASSASTMKNRIINGDMRIDQRNGGGSLTPASGTSTYVVDRFSVVGTQSSKFTAQQNQGSVTPPAGFTNYLGITSSSAYTSVSTDLFRIFHTIEGYNIADLAWGTSSAKAVTLSFWARSSLTGTFGGCLQNQSNNRAYAFTYSITSANTWTFCSITIPGETSGTWFTNNTLGLAINFDFGSGSTKQIAPGSWQVADANAATGCVSVVGTSGATLYITGMQLEAGSSATSFDFRHIGQELALCQRYCFVAVFNSNNYAGVCNTGTSGLASVPLPSPMRAAPTGTFPSGSYTADNGVTSLTFTPANMSINNSGVNTARVYFTSGTGGTFTGGQAFNTGTGTVVLSSEL